MLVDKARLREEAKSVRKAAFDRHGPKASERLAAHGLNFLPPAAGAIVSGFLAIRDEIDPVPLLNNLHAEGYRLALPVMVGKAKPLVMKAWAPGDELAETTWGIREPLASAPETFPDVVLVPLLVFDERGYRLGYGGGYYDRTLALLRRRKPIIAVGIAYDEQKVDAVPHCDYDERLDWVLTPSGPQKMARSLP
jgi:5-formyltetrahydrofolate cyclo-ligase